MKIGNTKIQFRTDFCSAENQKEVNKARLKRIAQKAQIALSAETQGEKQNEGRLVS